MSLMRLTTYLVSYTWLFGFGLIKQIVAYWLFRFTICQFLFCACRIMVGLLNSSLLRGIYVVLVYSEALFWDSIGISFNVFKFILVHIILCHFTWICCCFHLCYVCLFDFDYNCFVLVYCYLLIWLKMFLITVLIICDFLIKLCNYKIFLKLELKAIFRTN